MIDYFGLEIEIFWKIMIQAAGLILIASLTFAYNYLRDEKKIQIKDGAEVRVFKGDLFDDKIEKELGVIVIPVNTCFDMDAGDLISSESVHGQFIEKFEKDWDLKRKVTDALEGVGHRTIIRNGQNVNSYPLGTTIKIKHEGRTFFLLAFTEFDENDRAKCSPDEYCQIFFKLLKFADGKVQHNPLSMPVMGSRFARLPTNDQTMLIGLMISMIKLAGTKNPFKINIVVSYEDSKNIVFPHIR